MLPKIFTFVDVETTGTSSLHGRIIEIALVRVENNVVVSQYATLLNPQVSLDPFISNLTGITSAMLTDAPFFEDVQRKISELLQDSVFVAHNVSFDYGFIKSEFRRCGISFSAKKLCTVKLARFLYPGFSHYNLDSLIARYNFSCDSRHRALGDTLVLWQLYQKIIQEHSEETLEKHLQHVMREPRIPINLTAEQIRVLPAGPGVYLFYGDEEVPLYIGKSINIKDRVRSHFANDGILIADIKISQQIKRIETKTTAGELGALLLESRLIKQYQPIYNKKLRKKRKLIVLKKTTDNEGYHSVIISQCDGLTSDEIGDIISIFSSQKRAKDFLYTLCKQYNLCPKRLDIEKTNASCFFSQLGICKGACTQKENPLQYNMRFIQAFSLYKIKQWPFAGPIVIKEYNEEKEEHFFIDKWCLITQDIGSAIYPFDVDTYNILLRYVLQEKHQATITQVPFLTQEKIEQYSPYGL